MSDNRKLQKRVQQKLLEQAINGIEGAFVWRETEEGEVFWNDVHERLVAMLNEIEEDSS